MNGNRTTKYLMWEGRRVDPPVVRYENKDLLSFNLTYDAFSLSDSMPAMLVIDNESIFPVKIGDKFRLWLERVQE